MQLQVQVLYFHFSPIPFKSPVLGQQAAPHCRVKGNFAASHLKFVSHIVWSPPADPIREPTFWS